MSDNWHGTRFFSGYNISKVWGQIFLHCVSSSVDYISPLTAEIWVRERELFSQSVIDENIHKQLNETYTDLEVRNSIESVASTIFPESLLNQDTKQRNRNDFYKRFMDIWPRVKGCPPNRNGHYFHRMIAYQKNLSADKSEEFNQIEHVIQTYNGGNHRKSALQISVMDPRQDHSNEPIRGFPCLQHVNLIPHPSKGELDIVGYYANQYVFLKAYGNYLGLYRLGKFMAGEMGLSLSRVVCIAASAKLDDFKKYNKSVLQKLEKNLNAYLKVRKS